MKPRWHQAKFSELDGLQRNGWVKPIDANNFALFDGNATMRVQIVTYHTLVKDKNIVVGECLTLKAHLLIEERFSSCSTTLPEVEVTDEQPNKNGVIFHKVTTPIKAAPARVPSGLRALDERFGGQPVGEMHVIGSRSGTGRSQFQPRPHQKAAMDYLSNNPRHHFEMGGYRHRDGSIEVTEVSMVDKNPGQRRPLVVNPKNPNPKKG